jgi:hypothetical protein
MDGDRLVLSRGNSLDGHEYANSFPEEWGDFLGQEPGSSMPGAVKWGQWNNLKCSLLITNPPFAGEINEQYILDAYESQVGQRSRTATRELLFLERSINMLQPGGRMAIVLPQGVLTNSGSSYLRSWVLKKCKLLGVVGLHPYSFLPYTSVKTSLLFLERWKNEKDANKTYEVFFSVSQRPGKESGERLSDSNDYPDIAMAFASQLAAEKTQWARPVKGGSWECQWDSVPIEDIRQIDRMDAEYFAPKSRQLHEKIGKTATGKISDYVSAKIPRFKKRSFPEIAYIDIGSVDQDTGLVQPVIMPSSAAPSRASYLVLPGDVLVSTVRPERNVIGIITTSEKVPMVASNGFCILRPEGVSSELLFAYCKTNAFKAMLSRHATSSMYPTVSEKDVLSIPFVELDKATQKKITTDVKSSLEMILEARKKMQNSFARINDHLE